jgi:hypothetical protein
MSVLFTIFAPMSLILLHLRKRWWSVLAVGINCAIVYFLTTPLSAAVYFVIIGALSVTLAEMLKRKKSLEYSAILSLVMVAIVGTATVVVYSKVKSIAPWVEVKQEVSALAHYMVQSLNRDGAAPSWLGSGSSSINLEELRQKIIFDMPSTLAILLLILVWTNLLIVLRLNPRGFREERQIDSSYTKTWKVPEFLVWPTILTGAFLLKDFGTITVVALNLFKFLMALYAIQGLSIISYFFDYWVLHPTLRVMGYGFAVLLALPLVLSLGFFDLWFDFRSKFRQS